MSQSLVQIYLHIIFHIKPTSPKVQIEDQPLLFRYLFGSVKQMGGQPLNIGGTDNHIHILCTLPKTLTVPEFVKRIKYSSHKYIVSLSGNYRSFSWQNGYAAFSVSSSLLEKAGNYIQNQAEHHKKRTFEEEYLLLLKHYHVDYDERYVFVD